MHLQESMSEWAPSSGEPHDYLDLSTTSITGLPSFGGVHVTYTVMLLAHDWLLNLCICKTSEQVCQLCM